MSQLKTGACGHVIAVNDPHTACAGCRPCEIPDKPCEVCDGMSPAVTVGFYSRIFLVHKKDGGFRPVFDLKALNAFVVKEKFKLTTPQVVTNALHKGDWAVSIDLKDAYFHVPIHVRSRRLLRFALTMDDELRIFQFRALPFGLTSAPRVFTKVILPVGQSAHMRAVLSSSAPRPLVTEKPRQATTGPPDKLVAKVTAKFYIDENIKPRYCKPRPVPLALLEKVETELDRLKKTGVIRPVEYSEWAAPIVPVLKSTGAIRICGDYKVTINQAVKVDKYPIPNINDLFTKLTGGVMYTKLDLSHSYQQVVLDEESHKPHYKQHQGKPLHWMSAKSCPGCGGQPHNRLKCKAWGKTCHK